MYTKKNSKVKTNAAVNKASMNSKINNIEQVTIDIDNDKDHDNDDDNNVEEIKKSRATFITTTRAITATTKSKEQQIKKQKILK